MNNYASGLKALSDGITLLSIFIQNKPKTMAEVNNLYHFYYVGERKKNSAPLLDDYIDEIITGCKQLKVFTEERPKDVEGYKEAIERHLATAERCGLSDPNQYAYICTGTADEEPELLEWKRVYLVPLFSEVTASLINLRGKLSEHPAKRNAGGSKHIYPIPEKYKPIIKEVYDRLNGIAFQATESAFGTAIENADLSEIYGQQSAIKNKIAYMIYILSKVMGSEWYGLAAGSVNLEKKNCSGANVEYDMKILRDEIEKMRSKTSKIG